VAQRRTVGPYGILKVTILLCAAFWLLARGGNFLQQASKDVNFVIIWMDALRPDHLGCYGYPRNTSPHIDSVARQGSFFTQCITAASWTGASGVSLMTSQWPFQHGVNSIDLRVPAEYELLPEIMKKHGYATAGFAQSPLYYPSTGIDQGFDYYDWRPPKTLPIDTSGISDEERAQAEINAFHTILYRPASKIAAWMTEHKDQRFFLWIHLFYPHALYSPPEPYDKLFVNDAYYRTGRKLPIGDYRSGYRQIPSHQNLDNRTDIDFYISQYDGEIGFTDYKVGLIVKKLKELGILDKTVVIIASDHGESMGDNDFYFVHTLLYDSVIKIPLIIRLPFIVRLARALPKYGTITEQVRSIDIMPTILDIAGIPAPATASGKSLLSLLRGTEWRDRVALSQGHSIRGSFISETDQPGINDICIRERLNGALWKLIYHLDYDDPISGLRFQMFNLIEDPGETHNLIIKYPRIFGKLYAELCSYLQLYKTPAVQAGLSSIDPAARELLRSLGYLQ